MITVVKISAAIFGLVALGFALHRLACKLEDRGYIYYRKARGGTAGVVLHELDRLTRPSIQHVEEVGETSASVRADDAGDDPLTPKTRPDHAR